MIIRSLKLAAPALAAGSLLAISAPVAAADYFAGKVITIQVPSGPGASYHAYCQMVQRNIFKYIPGNPTTTIQNLPGGGGAKSASYMYNAAPKNGGVIAMIAPGTITVPLVRKVKYNAREFEWLGSPAARPYGLWAWHTTGIKTLEDTRKQEVTVATSGFAAAGSVLVRLMNATLGTKLKNIYGYRGGGQLNLAVERGEAQSRTNFYSGFMAAQPTWIKEKKVIPLIGMGPRDKHKEFIGVPHMRDLLKPGSLNQKVYDVLALNLKVGQGFYIPQGSPKNVRDILGDAFDKMVADPDFERQILARRIEFSPVPAAKIRKIIKDGFEAATPEVVKALKAIFKKTK
ncbi:tripartite tricarboxylate transporter substrate-binding protein [Alphaproteobacteria bacterium]|nr:tripartite tricarboxylate transporter substrate-binding protein [Alphaproteobacteria bacterium]